ncbi:ABC transporter ATP-binding protein [Cobetia amphilecti]|uniref:ABC transporter ATP-binding protein n=1 Tax=Cobetia amphilecti TaxID=1055104 RepID=UPI0034C5BE2E
MTDNAVIRVRDLNIGFHDRQQTWRPVLRGIDLSLGQGEILGLVGESGSGKSTLATAMLGLLRRGSLVRTGEVSVATPAPASGSTSATASTSAIASTSTSHGPLHDEHRQLSFHHQPGRWLGELRLGLVSQHAEKAMTPHLTLGSLLCETLLSQGVKGKAAREQQAVAWLRRVHLPHPEVLMQRYPHQLSGGQQQRASLALALAQRPRVLVMDEPATGLDASTQNEILALLASLRAELGMSIVFVSHDLGAVSHLCDRVAVMYAGQLVEVAATRDFLNGPRHPYGHALLALIGESGSGKTSILKALAGLLSPVSGQLSLRQESLAGLVAERRPVQRQKIQYIFQHASTALNPRLTVFESLAPVLSRWFDLKGDGARQRAQSLLEEVRLPALYLDRLPSQLSGGEQQRVAIARALAAEPDILLCDEITSALDVSVQAAIIRLLQRLKRERGLSLVFVTHDLGLVSHFADRVLVLRNGRTEHLGDVASLATGDLPPYVQTLMEAKLVAA